MEAEEAEQLRRLNKAIERETYWFYRSITAQRTRNEGRARELTRGQRREDVPLLCAHFLKEFNHRHGKKVTGIAEPLRKIMAAYDWPGNVRELRNLIESMIVQDVDGNSSLFDDASFSSFLSQARNAVGKFEEFPCK